MATLSEDIRTAVVGSTTITSVFTGATAAGAVEFATVRENPPIPRLWYIRDSENEELDLSKALDLYAFKDGAGVMGQVASDLGLVYRSTGIERPNSTVLFAVLQASPSVIGNMIKLEGDDLADRLHDTLERIDSVAAWCSNAKMSGPSGALIAQEFNWVVDMLRHACRRFLWVMGEKDTKPLAEQANHLLAEHHVIWQARNRPGGFRESQARLQAMANAYR